MMQNRFPLGTVIAERRIQLYERTGEARWITVRLGSPVGVYLEDGSPLRSGDLEEGTFRCPIQILGLDHDEGVYAAFGEDPFVALQFAIISSATLTVAGAKAHRFPTRYRET